MICCQELHTRSQKELWKPDLNLGSQSGIMKNNQLHTMGLNSGPGILSPIKAVDVKIPV